MNYTVKESKWYRGKDNSKLLALSGDMCCLGFVGLQCGYSESEIRMKGIPAQVGWEKWPEWFLNEKGQQSKDMFRMMAINDCKNIDDETRKKKLTEIMAAHGDTLTFVP